MGGGNTPAQGNRKVLRQARSSEMEGKAASEGHAQRATKRLKEKERVTRNVGQHRRRSLGVFPWIRQDETPTQAAGSFLGALSGFLAAAIGCDSVRVRRTAGACGALDSVLPAAERRRPL